jgi:hypothetical protein
MPIPYPDWYRMTWKIREISLPPAPHPDVEPPDEVSFTPLITGTVFELRGITCTHGMLHGLLWNNVTCTGDPANLFKATGITNTVPGNPLSSKRFEIISATPGPKEELVCHIDAGPLGRACWIAEE